MTLPEFKEGVQYEQINRYKFFAKYRFKLLKPTIVNVKLPIEEPIIFRDKKGRVWAEVQINRIIILKGYAYNGCSPKIKVFGLWLGPPDFPDTLLATLVHDVLTQFDPEGKIVPRKFYDKIFKEILEASGSKVSGLYYAGARIGTFL